MIRLSFHQPQNRAHRGRIDPGGQGPKGDDTASEGTPPALSSVPANTDRASPSGGTHEARDVSSFNIFSPLYGGAASGFKKTLSVEEVLEKGLNGLELSPVHLAFRGTANADSVRCEWRGVAQTLEQREAAIRFWLELDDDDPLPAPSEVEARFLRILEAIGPAFPETVKANFRDLARGGLSADYVFLTCFVDFGVAEYLVGSGTSTA